MVQSIQKIDSRVKKYFGELTRKIDAMKNNQLHLEDVIEISKEFYLNMTFEDTPMKGVKA